MGKLNLSIATLLVLIAAFFRISNLDLIEFKADEGINLFLATRPVFGHPFPPGGTVSSLGVLNFPLMNYLLFPAVLISTDPRFIVLLIGLVNSLSVGLLFLIFNRYHGTKNALITAIFIALSPWAILFSRKIWAQDLIFPLTIPLIFSIYKITMDKKDKYWMLYAISCLLLIQIHQSTIFFLAPLFLFLSIKKRPNLKYLLMGTLIGILPTLPYITYQLANSCPDCTALGNVKERLLPVFFPQIFIRPFQILGRGNFQTIMGSDMVTFLREFPLIFQLQKVFYLEYLLLPAGCLLFWKKFTKLRPILVSMASLPFIYFFMRVEPFIHYFIVILPFLFLMISFAVTSLLDSKKILLRTIGSTSLLLLVITSVLFNYALFELIKLSNGLKGDYGTTYIKTRKATESLFKNYRNDPGFEEMLITSYIPPSLLHGDIGIAKMVYSKEKIDQEMIQIENRLRIAPDDPRMHAKLIYYYTQTPPTEQTLQLLEQKLKYILGYFPVYLEVKRFYIDSH